ncbi:MAG: tyrosine-type recombinase/integrase [Lachnospiraceae bacterium]|nr:tyrosine-type recombinase/integrase [Lachnospiraceae bacterium]
MAKNNNGKNTIQEIPKLPHGQGSISWIPERNKFLYKKNVNGHRKSVLGNTVKEVMAEMNRIEKESTKRTVIQKAVTLSDAMYDWLKIYKKPKLKKTSYDTLEKTVRSRIAAYDIGSMRFGMVDSDMIQKHLNMLNEEENLSYSTVKKCYDALNDFYRNRLAGGKIETNPMQAVVMLNRENIIKETKKIEFFDEEDIKKFTTQAALLRTWSKKPQYQYGFCLCANIFLGLRAGEMLALKWKDVDFIDGTVYVHENLQLVSNPLGSPAQVYETQSLKNYQNRTVRMNSNAKHFLELQKKYSGFTAPDDYVCCTRDGKHATVSYLSNNIKEIEKAAGTKVKSYGTHITRHTCASLYFKKGVRTELIAALLGHSVEVCRKTYIHFEEEQKKEAVKLLDDYEINYRFW